MKRIIFLVAGLCSHPATVLAYVPQEGDIAFQTSRSSQSVAIQRATSSPYSHVGVVLFRKGKPYVFEAIQPVSFTPLKAWLDHGKGGHYVIKRTRKPLSGKSVAKLHRYAGEYLGKPYDLTFEWSDDRIYCSELVWKLYKQAADVELAPLAKLRSFKLDDPQVKQKLKSRYGDQVPLDEPVISAKGARLGIFAATKSVSFLSYPCPTLLESLHQFCEERHDEHRKYDSH